MDDLPPREPSPSPTQTIRVAYEDEMSQADPLLPPDLRSLKGRELTDEEPRFAIKYALTKPVFNTVNKMQLVLNSLAAYIPDRTFRDILLHAASLEELKLAWQVYEKYFAEALKEQGARNIDTLSQLATTPSTVYREIETKEEPHQRLRLALGGLPNARPTAEERAEARRTSAYLETDIRRMVVVPREIEEAFPYREPELNPKLIYYDELNRLRAIPPKTTYENPLGYTPVESPKGSRQEGSSGRRGEEGAPLPPQPPPPPPRPPRSARSASSSSSSLTSTSTHNSSRASSSSSDSSAPERGRGRRERKHRKARRSAFHEMRLQPIEEEDPPPSDPNDSSDDDRDSRRGRRGRKEKKKKRGGDGRGDPPGDAPGTTGAARTPVAGINPLIKPESLPSWDGNRNTVMVYFWNIVELARQGGRMPQALGDETRKEHMRQSHRHYISAIRRHYLGPAWISALSSEFRMQHFRDPKNPRESPQDFVYRRIMYCRSLDYALENSRQEAKLIMDLLARVIEHSEDLLLAYHRDRKLENAQDKSTSRTSGRTSTGATRNTPQVFEAEAAASSEGEEELPLSGDGATPDVTQRDLFAVAYAVATKRAAAKPPPGPCFACGSPNHWNKDCPHWEEYERKQKENGMLIETAEDLAYNTAYVLVVGEALDAEEVFVMEVPPFVNRIEEIAEDYWHNGECLPVDSLYDLECIVEGYDGVSELEGRGVKEEINLVAGNEERLDGESALMDKALLAVKPYEPGKLKLVPRRGPLRIPDGNMSVLSVRGRVGSAFDIEIDLRVDSGASVTLVSLAHYQGLISPPPLRTNEGSQLMQLTSRNAPVKGKTRLSFQIFANDGTVLEAECEVQIVEGMTVPVLLGEDFQQAYELSVTRTLEIDGSSSTTLVFGGAPEHPISATPVRRTKDYDRVAKSFLGEMPAEKIARGSFKTRAKQKLRELKRKAQWVDSLILAEEQVRLPPHSCVKVKVTGPFESPGEWIVEKLLLSSDDDRFLMVPNTLISSDAPYVPLANPSDTPRIIRKGETLGRAVRAEEYFDKPGTKDRLDKMQNHADRMAKLCAARTNKARPKEKTKKATTMPHSQNYGAWAAGQKPARSRFHMPDADAPRLCRTRIPSRVKNSVACWMWERCRRR
ncbi:hypothetical protein K523DRAFT_343732 [Schizophyllum commune Tattone D]|nr:hypothetical protein K523DRAFT_343732 [Schizophyllum commune Tattone D]